MEHQLPFESLNETDIREEVIAPLIRKLGYGSGSKNNVRREVPLRYRQSFLGRKNPKKDPELRGKADYILEADQRVRWVVEAKGPAVTLGPDEVEQAWSYANHPEVRAVYFVLCNGRALEVYRTDHGPDVPPVLALHYPELETKFQVLSNLLSPTALLRDFPNREIDVGLPIAPNLRSAAQITNGMINNQTNSLGNNILNELKFTIKGGSIARDVNNNLVMALETSAPLNSLQKLNERLGLASFEMTSADNQLSANPSCPTVFKYEHQVIFPAGEKLFDLTTWQQNQLNQNISCHIQSEASGSFNQHIFSGCFTTVMHYIESGITISMSGSFEANLV